MQPDTDELMAIVTQLEVFQRVMIEKLIELENRISVIEKRTASIELHQSN